MACKALIADGVAALTGSETPISAANLPSTLRKEVFALFGDQFGCIGQFPQRDTFAIIRQHQ